MTPAASILDPASNPALSVSSVLTLYVDLPDTPWRASTPDQRQARSWFDRGVSLPLVETALLLASLRRMTRPPDVPPLPRIRSRAYFQPVIEELLESPAPDGYLQYLRLKLRSFVDKTVPTDVQNTTFSDDVQNTTFSDERARRPFWAAITADEKGHEKGETINVTGRIGGRTCDGTESPLMNVAGTVRLGIMNGRLRH